MESSKEVTSEKSRKSKIKHDVESVSYDRLTEELVAEFLLVKKSEGITPKTMSRYAKACKKFLNWTEGKEFTRTTYIEYNSCLQETQYSDWYIRGNQQVVKNLIGYLNQNECNFPIPIYKLQKLHRKKLLYLETPQVKTLLSSLKTDKEKLIVRLLLSTGLRLNESVMLNWEDINLTNGKVLVHYGKGDKYRVTVMDKETCAFMMKYKNRRKLPDTSPVIATGNHRMTDRGVASLLLRIKERTGINFTAHALRRTFARQAVINGLDIIWLQQLMGHTSLELTRAYVGQLDTDDVILQYQMHSPLMGIK